MLRKLAACWAPSTSPERPASFKVHADASGSTGGGIPGPATLWSRRFGTGRIDALESFAVSPAGNLALVGRYYGPLDFGGGPLPEAANHPNLFVVGLDAAGNHLFSRFLAGDEPVEGYEGPRRSVAFDSQGDIVVAGARKGDVGFGCGTVDAAWGDAFIAKLDPQGECLWSKRFPGSLLKHNIHVAVAPSGEIVVAGIFLGTVDFGGGVLDAKSNGMLHDGRLFLARFDSQGNHLWSKKLGQTTVEDVQLAVDASGSILLGGAFHGTIDFGGGPLITADSQDIYVARLDPAGNHVWSNRFGHGGKSYAFGLTAGSARASFC